MFIKKIWISNFGPVKKADLALYDDKPNFILGDNATGKTQIIGAIYSLFFDDRVLVYNKESNLLSEVEVNINIGNNDFLKIKREYINNKSRIILEHFDDVYRCTEIKRSNIYFYNIEDLRSENDISSENIKEAIEFLKKLEISNDEIDFIFYKLKIIEEYVYLSAGQQALLGLLNTFTKIPSGSIFIGDSLFSIFDSKMLQSIINVLNKIKHIQLILFESTIFQRLNNPEMNLLFLSNDLNKYSISPVFYNYKKLLHGTKSGYVKNNNKIPAINYRIGETISEEECRNVEFKEIKGNNPCSSIIKNAEIYIISYLNCTQISDTGRILFGISDNRVVKGVKLTRSEKDNIRREISVLIGQAEPYISPDSYSIRFKEIANEKGIIEDLYIIEISITSCFSKLLYATAKGEVFIKTEGGKIKLTPSQIQREAIIRANNVF